MKKALFLLFLGLMGISTVFAQTGHELFMNGKIKPTTAGNMNSWMLGGNTFSTNTTDDFNSWHFSTLGQDGEIHTSQNDDWSAWQVDGLDIEAHLTTAGNYNSWTITGEGVNVTLFTTNWNTWALTGGVVSGISTTTTEDLEEWAINGGNWMQLSPSYRTMLIFMPVFTSAIYKQILE
ncbi:MAG: hypothetical protein ABJG68_14400 [Crocinitomicaceae bacterium]